MLTATDDTQGIYRQRAFEDTLLPDKGMKSLLDTAAATPLVLINALTILMLSPYGRRNLDLARRQLGVTNDNLEGNK